MNNYERADCNLLQIHDNFYIEGEIGIEYTKGLFSVRYVRFEHEGKYFYCEATPVNGLKFDDRWVWTLDEDKKVVRYSIDDAIDRMGELMK